MNLQENISKIIKQTAKEYNCSSWDINNGYCEDFAQNLIDKLGGYNDNLFELSGDMFFNQRDVEFAKENWGDIIETKYGVWSKKMLDYWGYPPNFDLDLADDEINHTWIYYNGKHYDAEVPNGVKNWYDIPLIERFLKRRNKKNQLQENISRIKQVMGINESNTNRLRRLLHRVDYLVDHVIQYSEYEDDFCSIFKSALSYFDYVTSEINQALYYNYFEDIDDSSEEWKEVYDMMVKYVDEVHGHHIRDHWLSMCNN